MNLSNVVIVLDHPDESRNIGSACRAMANSDIKTLRIVGKKENYDVEKVHVLAIHAAYIFDNAQFYDSIKEATADCAICAGTTRRRGKNRGKLLLPEEFAGMTSTTTESNGKVAVVFGNERTGLTDPQLDECNVGVTIPTSDEFGSLNLSHAVQLICYHMFREKKGDIKGYTPLTLNRIDTAVQNITDNMKEMGFFKMPGREDMEAFWRSILSRANMSEGEAQYLEKTFKKMSGLFKKNSKEL